MRTLVVVSHPNPDSLTRAALARVLAGLKRQGAEVRIIDLDAEAFDPRLTVDEKRRHLDPPESKPHLAQHTDALRWAQRLVLVYPTWFGGFPARLKGWFDRTWVAGVAFELPEGSSRIQGKLRNIRRIDIVTTHGSPRWVNLLQGNPGRLTVSRTLRMLCHPRCRVKATTIYGIDWAGPDEIEAWLDAVEERYAG